jgi:4-hydroxy-4-methyl-2-oxoglutarate aldolase
MLNVIVTDPPRADLAEVDKLAAYGVATVHEAIGRNGYLGPRIRPSQQGARIAGTALTVLCWPGDNLMIHAAVEQAKPGDIIVVTTTSPSSDGAFGELLATSLVSRGVRGLIMGAGLRDTQELRDMGFPAWTAHVSFGGPRRQGGQEPQATRRRGPRSRHVQPAPEARHGGLHQLRRVRAAVRRRSLRA